MATRRSPARRSRSSSSRTPTRAATRTPTRAAARAASRASDGGFLGQAVAFVRRHPIPVIGAALGATAIGTYLTLRRDRAESNGRRSGRADADGEDEQRPSLLREVLRIVAPEPDLTDVLEREHAEAKAMFLSLEADRAAERRPAREVFDALCDSLDRHAFGEESVFYPELKGVEETRAETLEALTEHEVVRNLLAELGPLIYGGDEWWAKLHVLKEYVLHHAREEERAIFPAARRVLDRERRTSLVREYLDAKARAPVRLAT